MKQDKAEMWVEALRSGKYKKTYGRLKDNNGYCCLGVLCDISKVSKWEQDEPYNRFTYLNNTWDTPDVVMEWSGMENTDDDDRMSEEDLMGLNDKGFSFDEIADVIQMTWQEL